MCVSKLGNCLKTAGTLQFAENTAHRENPQRATETGDPVSSWKFSFTRFLTFHLFIQFGGEVGSSALHSTLKWLTPLKPGSSSFAIPVYASPGQEGPVTTVATTNNTHGRFNAAIIHARHQSPGSKALIL